MKTIITNACRQISKFIETVRETGESLAIGWRNKPEVSVIKFPSEYNSQLDDITNANTYSESFAFLDNEPNLYSGDDLKKSAPK